MWIWQLIIRRAKKVTIPLTKEKCYSFLQIYNPQKAEFFNYTCGCGPAPILP